MPTYKTKSDFQNELWGRVNKSSQGALEMALKQQIAKNQRQQELEEQKKLLQLKAQYDPDTMLINSLLGGEQTGAYPINTQQDKLGSMSVETISPQTDTGLGLDKSKIMRGMLSKKLGVPYETMMSPEEKQAGIDSAVKKYVAMETAKPYSPEEIKISSKQLLIPKIDELINLVENKDVYEGLKVPFGASRISSFGEAGPWQSIKKGLTAGAGREAGLILQDLKRLLFQEGGAALTETEIEKLAPKLNPAYKTEKQWVSDLKDVKNEVQVKARMLRPNPNEVFKNTFSGQPETQNDPLGLR